MKELVLRENPRARLALSSVVRDYFRQTQATLVRRSAVVWGEHCSECAFPSCYSSCEFYTPRSDMHCRRFVHGIEAIDVEESDDLTGLTRIQFRRWGKLEGSGVPQMHTAAQVTKKEANAARIDSALAVLPLPKRVGNSLAYRFNTARKASAIGASGVSATSVFIIEGWLEHPEPITMTISMMPWDKGADGLFQKQFTFRQGYNREVIPTSAITQSMALDAPFAIQIEVVGEVPSQPVIFGVVEFAEIAQALPNMSGATSVAEKTAKQKTVKCVVWDLDDTVWEGTLVEDGIEGVKLNPAAAEAMRQLDARGILNSVASKNDEALALAALKHFGLAEFILFPQINWGPKSDSVRRIAELIDIGLDTFVFIDDQPFERGEVAASHSSVTILTPEDIAGLVNHPLFDVPVTEESKKRRFMYRDEEKRQKAASGAGTDYLGFLRGCAITLEVMPVTKDAAERVYELTQRTNQLNVTGARFTREQVQAFVDGNATSEGFVLRCRDNFGDYGIIGFCVLNPASTTIEAFFMSCRVQRKRVEHAFFAWLSQRLAIGGAQQLTISYRKTAKNIAAVKMFQELGFALNESIPGEGNFTRALADALADADIVAIQADALMVGR